MVGPVIAAFGSQEQKEKFLPATANLDIWWCQGFSEPEAGSDLASLRTTAVRDGDHYIINGQKVFTSYGHYADYFWLSARTDPKAAKKHQGISILMVDAKSPGITVKPQWVMGRYKVNQEFFDNVRVPKECLMGQENQGSKYMVMQLSRERQSMACHSMVRRWIEDVTQWAKTTRMNGAPVIEQEWVKNKLAVMMVETEVLRLLSFRVAWMLAQGKPASVESAMIKAFGTEMHQRTLNSCLEIMGRFGQLKQGSKWAPMRGWMERMSQMNLQTTFGGGTNEVLRDIVATMGMGLMKTR
ncbi:MAG: acyl-CoA dehydrogenase family protein [Chloroflexi bacterium]|nr:acyl-CoA dehydrogenase family protein [Chloroflexota bacterium]